MPQAIPEESLRQIKEFRAQQKLDEERRGRAKEPRRSKKPEFPRVVSSREAISIALDWGLGKETGKGFHGTHLIGIDGEGSEYECAVPDHPGDLAKGTWSIIRDFIKEHGTSPD